MEPVQKPFRTGISQSRISLFEDDRLRDEVESIKQGQYETTASYGRRFRQIAAQAYEGAPQGNNEDQRRR